MNDSDNLWHLALFAVSPFSMSLLGHTPVYISDLLTSVADVPARSALHASSSVADTPTNRRGFLCCRIASMEHAADRAEAAAVDHYFSSPA